MFTEGHIEQIALEIQNVIDTHRKVLLEDKSDTMSICKCCADDEIQEIKDFLSSILE